jgi:hypothetical protein
MDLHAVWEQALPYHQFVEESSDNRHLWKGMYRVARVPAWAIDRVRSTGGRHHLLVIAEEWCGDGSSTVPYLAKLADVSRGLDVRVIRRDEHPEVMDRYLTAGARSIPIVIVLDRECRELGHWGPRPSALQRWFHEARRTADKTRLFPQIRGWYARDKGESVLREVLALLEREPSVVSSHASGREVGV